MRQSPTVKLRRLTNKLVELRDQAGLSCTEAAKRAGCTPSTLTRLEARKSPQPKAQLIESLLDVYKPSRELREAMLSWATQARGRGWWHEYRGILGEHTQYLALEHEVDSLRVFESSVVHGLLQTEDYTRGLILGRAPGASEEAITTRVKVRKQRQDNLLHGPDPVDLLWVILDEAVLLRPVGGRDVMLAQLDHLVECAAMKRVILQVLPLDRGAHAGQGPFSVLSWPHPQDPEAIYCDTPTGELWVEGKQEVQNFLLTFELLVAKALSRADSVKAIEAVKERLAKMPPEIGTDAYLSRTMA